MEPDKGKLNERVSEERILEHRRRVARYNAEKRTSVRPHQPLVTSPTVHQSSDLGGPGGISLFEYRDHLEQVTSTGSEVKGSQIVAEVVSRCTVASLSVRSTVGPTPSPKLKNNRSSSVVAEEFFEADICGSAKSEARSPGTRTESAESESTESQSTESTSSRRLRSEAIDTGSEESARATSTHSNHRFEQSLKRTASETTITEESSTDVSEPASSQFITDINVSEYEPSESGSSEVNHSKGTPLTSSERTYPDATPRSSRSTSADLQSAEPTIDSCDASEATNAQLSLVEDVIGAFPSYTDSVLLNKNLSPTAGNSCRGSRLRRSSSAPDGLRASPDIQPPWDADDVHSEDLENDPEMIGAPAQSDSTSNFVLPRFEPYHKVEDNISKINDALYQILKKPQLINFGKVAPVGYIYMYTVPGWKGYVKIGITRRDPQNRIQQWRNACGVTCHLVQDIGHKQHKHYALIEKLIAIELRNQRYKYPCSICNAPNTVDHQEWYKVSVEEASKVVQRWRTWIVTHDPYTSKGELSPFWTRRFEMMNKSCIEWDWATWLRDPSGLDYIEYYWHRYMMQKRTNGSRSRWESLNNSLSPSHIVSHLCAFFAIGRLYGLVWSLLFVILIVHLSGWE